MNSGARSTTSEPHTTLLEVPVLMGLAAVISGLTSWAAMLVAARNYGETGGVGNVVPHRAPKRRR